MLEFFSSFGGMDGDPYESGLFEGGSVFFNLAVKEQMVGDAELRMIERELGELSSNK